MTKKTAKRYLAVLLVMSLCLAGLTPAALAADKASPDNTAFGTMEAKRTLLWTDDDLSPAEARALINNEPLHPQKTGWAELDKAIEDLLSPYADQDAYTRLYAAYDFLVKNVTYSWDGYSRTIAPAYNYFTKLDYLKDMTYDLSLVKSIPDDMANRTYHVLTAKKGICYDYAIALAVIARYIGIESYVHTGYFIFEDAAKGTGHHGWTILVLGGKDYVFDSQRDARNWQYYRRTGYYFGIPAANAFRYTTVYDQKDNAARDASMLDMEADRISYSKVTVNVQGAGSVSGSGTYLTGTTVTLTAAPSGGASFLGWYDRNNTFLGKDLSYTWTLAGNTTITARFGFQITAAGTENGTVSGGGAYVSGENVILTATPKKGYSFVGWYDGSGKLLSKDEKYTFAASRDLIAQARFVKTDEANTVTVQIEGSGTVLGGGLYAPGTAVTLTATPIGDGAFLGWYDRLGTFLGSDLSYTWTLAGNTTVTAKFGVTLNLWASSTGTATGGGAYEKGAQAALTAEPKPGYSFTGWFRENGACLSRDLSYTHTVTQTETIVAMFSGDDFYDVKPTAWYAESVQEGVDRGLLSGTSEILFSPDAQLTRAQVVTILARIDEADLDSAPSAGFADVSDSAWYAGAVNWAWSKGVATGISDAKFGPNDPITRQDFVVMLMRYLEKCWSITPAEGSASFTDMSSVRSYAVKPVQQAVGLGLINGYADGSFRPEGKLLRKEGVKVFVLLDQYLDQYREEDPLELLAAERLAATRGAEKVDSAVMAKFCQYIVQEGPEGYWKTHGDWEWSFVVTGIFEGQVSLLAKGPVDSSNGTYPICSLTYYEEDGHIEESEHELAKEVVVPKETDEDSLKRQVAERLAATQGAEKVESTVMEKFCQYIVQEGPEGYWKTHGDWEWSFSTVLDGQVTLIAKSPIEDVEHQTYTLCGLTYYTEDGSIRESEHTTEYVPPTE